MQSLLPSRLRQLLAVVVWLGVVVAAQADIAVPSLHSRVTDLTATLSAEQSSALEQKLAEFEKVKGSQIAVLMVPTTQPDAIEQYGIRVAEQWKIGRKGIDDGAILIVAKDDHRIRIEVGYGLEGALNDAVAKRIISETIAPRFKAGDYAGGADAGVDQIVKVINGEPLPILEKTRLSRFYEQIDTGKNPLFLIAGLLLLSICVISLLRKAFGTLLGSFVVSAAVGIFMEWLGVSAAVTAIGCVGSYAYSVAICRLLLYVGEDNLSAMADLISIGSNIGGRSSGGGANFRGGGGGFGGGGASGSW